MMRWAVRRRSDADRDKAERGSLRRGLIAPIA